MMKPIVGVLAWVCFLLGLPGATHAQDQGKSTLDRFLDRYDRNKDGIIDRMECPEAMRRAFLRLDANGDGKLSREELKRFEDRLGRFLGPGGAQKPRPGGRPGEIITPAARGERLPERLKVGDVAPDFTLPLLKGRGQVTLSSFQGKQPVVLILASYT